MSNEKETDLTVNAEISEDVFSDRREGLKEMYYRPLTQVRCLVSNTLQFLWRIGLSTRLRMLHVSRYDLCFSHRGSVPKCYLGLFNALNGLGAGGQGDSTISANANAAHYATFAFAAFFAGYVQDL